MVLLTCPPAPLFHFPQVVTAPQIESGWEGSSSLSTLATGIWISVEYGSQRIKSRKRAEYKANDSNPFFFTTTIQYFVLKIYIFFVCLFAFYSLNAWLSCPLTSLLLPSLFCMYKKKMFIDKRRAITIYIHVCLYLHKFCKDIQKLTSLRERNKTGQMGDRCGKFFAVCFLFLD